MGFELMAWQRRLFDIALERIGSNYVYNTVGQSIARQNAKTLNLSLRIGLELQRRNSRVLYTSTDRGLAVDRWREISEVLLQSGFAPHIRHMRRSIGEEALVCHNGAVFRPVTPSARAAGRGQSAVSLVVVDEVAQLRDFGAIGALLPTQLTVSSSQLWLASNAGESAIDAPVWHHYTELGRKAVSDKAATMAWFEWAAEVADPDTFDPGDVEHWHEAMPMLAAGIITEASVRNLYETMPREDFMREALNVWGNDINALVIDPGDWAVAFRPDVEVDGNELRMAFDVAPNNEAASISAATFYDSEPVVAVEVIEARAGTSWLVERAVELATKWKPPHLVVDASSPAGAFADLIEAKGVTVERLTGREFAGACGLFLSTIQDHHLAHLDQTPLNEAVSGAVKLAYGGDLWRWNRRRGYVISPLCSATMAVADALVKPRARTPGVW